MPPVEAVEKQLYRMASTLEEYQRYSSLGFRITRLVTEWRSLQACAHEWVLTCSSWLWLVRGLESPRAKRVLLLSIHACMPTLFVCKGGV